MILLCAFAFLCWNQRSAEPRQLSKRVWDGVLEDAVTKVDSAGVWSWLGCCGWMLWAICDAGDEAEGSGGILWRLRAGDGSVPLRGSLDSGIMLCEK